MSFLSQKQIKTSLSFYCEAQQKTVSLLTDMFVSKFLKVDIPQASIFFYFLFFCQVAPVCWERYIFSDELLPYRLKCCIYLVLILSIVKKPVKAHLGATCSPQGSNPAGPFFHLCISCYYGRTAHLALLVLKTDIHEGHKIQYSFTFYKMLGQMNKCCRGNGIIYL